MWRSVCVAGGTKQPHHRAVRDDFSTDVGGRTVLQVRGGTAGPHTVIEQADVQSRHHRDISVNEQLNVELSEQQSARWQTTAERQHRSAR